MSEWKERPRPPRLEKRYEFDDYEALRQFLDDAAELSEKEDLYPDIGFARDYANITIHAEEGETQVTDRHRRFAKMLDELR